MIAKKQKEPKYPSTDERINKVWDSYATEQYSTIKKNELPIHALTWMNLENIMQSNKPDTKRHILYDFICLNYPEQVNPQRQKTNQWISGAEEIGGTGSDWSMGLVCFQVIKMFWNQR